MPTVRPEISSQYQQAFQELAQNQPRPPLPNLKAEPNFLDELGRWFDELWARLFRSGSLDVSTRPHDSGWLAGLWDYLFWIVVVLLALLLAVLLGILIRHVRAKRKAQTPKKSVKKPPVLSPAQAKKAAGVFTDSDLDRALAELDFGRAGRLRWKLFLTRSQLRLNLTPREALHQASAFASPEECFSLVIEQNQLMFHPQRASLQRYEFVHRLLSQFESARQEGPHA